MLDGEDGEVLAGGRGHVADGVTPLPSERAYAGPYLRVVVFADGLHETNIDEFFTSGGLLDAVIEECDGLDTKILARQEARRLGVPVIMETSDRGTLDLERFDLEPDRPLLHGWLGQLDTTPGRLAALHPAHGDEQQILMFRLIVGPPAEPRALRRPVADVLHHD